MGFVFGRGSNVLAYWLTRAEGFDVRSRGARIGSVREVRPGALVLRSPFLHRTRIVSPDLIESVDPEARVLELAGDGRTRPGARLKEWSDGFDRRADQAADRLRPRVRAWALAAWAGARTRPSSRQ